jgi:hypothetical protein
MLGIPYPGAIAIGFQFLIINEKSSNLRSFGRDPNRISAIFGNDELLVLSAWLETQRLLIDREPGVSARN